MQHELVNEERSLHRQGAEITARTGYAGGTRVGENGLVCYHNPEHVAVYGELGHAEVVTISVPESRFGAFVARYWKLCPRGERHDPWDVGLSTGPSSGSRAA